MKKIGYVCGFMVVFIWSGWIIVSKYGLNHQILTPYDIMGLRFMVGTFVTLPLIYLFGIKWRDIFNIKTILCATGCGFPYVIAAFKGIASAPASNAGVLINGTMPIFSALLSIFILKTQLNKIKLFGIILVVIANAILIYGTDLSFNTVSWFLIAALLFSSYTISIHAFKLSAKTIMTSVSLINFLLFLPLWFFLPSNLSAAPVSEIALQSFYQGFLVSVLSLSLITQCVNSLGAISASTIIALVPCVAAFFASLFLDEVLTVKEVSAALICTIGIIVFNGGLTYFVRKHVQSTAP